MQNLTCSQVLQVEETRLSFGLITPSYSKDFERCRLLCESRDRFWPETVRHYIVVDTRDLALFKILRNSRTEIIAVEDVLPWWIKRLPILKQGWINFKGFPIRNWILQQLVKLSMANILDEDILGFVDSDVVFIRSFDPWSFVQAGQVRLYRNPDSVPSHWRNFSKWYQTTERLLGLPPVHYPAPNFISDLITWRRSLVLKLHQYLELRFHRYWLETLASTIHWSEYILYGMFVEHILKQESGHYYDPVCPGLQYFSTQPMTDLELRAFLAKIQSDQIMVMISAKAKIDPNRYEHILD